MAVSSMVRELAEGVARSAGYDLIHMEYRREHGGWVLRLYIDKSDGVSHQDCVAMSRQVASKLDEENIMDHRYRLEVSSPGLDRPLFRPEDFRRFVGHVIKVRTTVPIAGARNHKGLLQGTVEEEGDVYITIQVSGDVYQIPLQSIATARLKPELIV